MKFDPVLLLVVLAVVLIVFLLIFGTDKTIPTLFRSRKRRKVLLGQLTVVVLLIVTMVTLAWPIKDMHSLIQGVLLCSVILVPAFVFNELISLHYHSAYFESTTITASGEAESWFTHDEGVVSYLKKRWEDRAANKNNSEGFFSKVSTNDPVDIGNDSNSIIYPSVDAQFPDAHNANQSSKIPHRKQSTARSRLPPTIASVLSGILRSNRNSEKDADVEKQLERVSQVVQSHDLGVQDTIPLYADAPSKVSAMRQAPSTPEFNDLASTDGMTVELQSMARSEMAGLVTSLQTDNGRLQKLVIAQHAVIESQRESQNKSRELAHDAIKLMHDAQSNQRMAEKLARREKTERQRIQLSIRS